MIIHHGLSLIIPSYRNPQYLDLCLESATKNQKDHSEIIVILDGYVEESAHLMEKYPTVDWMDLPENKGMQYALNAGVSQASYEYVFIVNDDNVLPVAWDKRILKDIDRATRQYATQKFDVINKFVLTVQQVEPDGPSMFNFDIRDFGQTPETFDYANFMVQEQRRIDTQEEMFVEDGHIFPFVMKKQYYMAVGGFDTLYDSPNWCDVDFFLKLELLGFKFPRTRNVALYHFGSVSTKKNAEKHNFIQKESDATHTFMWKWGYLPNLVYNAMNNDNSKYPQDGQFRGFSV